MYRGKKKIDWVQKGGLSSKQAENLDTYRRTAIDAKKKDSEFYRKQGIHIISILDDNFPVRLKHWIDCPILLFTKGNIELNPLRTMAIIGTRKPIVMSLELTKNLFKNALNITLRLLVASPMELISPHIVSVSNWGYPHRPSLHTD